MVRLQIIQIPRLYLELFELNPDVYVLPELHSAIREYHLINLLLELWVLQEAYHLVLDVCVVGVVAKNPRDLQVESGDPEPPFLQQVVDVPPELLPARKRPQHVAVLGLEPLDGLEPPVLLRELLLVHLPLVEDALLVDDDWLRNLLIIEILELLPADPEVSPGIRLAADLVQLPVRSVQRL